MVSYTSEVRYPYPSNVPGEAGILGGFFKRKKKIPVVEKNGDELVKTGEFEEREYDYIEISQLSDPNSVYVGEATEAHKGRFATAWKVYQEGGASLHGESLIVLNEKQLIPEDLCDVVDHLRARGVHTVEQFTELDHTTVSNLAGPGGVIAWNRAKDYAVNRRETVLKAELSATKSQLQDTQDALEELRRMVSSLTEEKSSKRGRPRNENVT